MEKKDIRKILRESELYSEAGIKQIMRNVRTPSLANAIKLEKEFKVPVTTWDGWIDTVKRDREKQ